MSSKLRKLKQQAYEAGKKRDWAAAMAAYAQILEFDKSNPSLLNEYGDVCLKAGDTGKAVRQFLSAASRYRSTGLLNNAQAVYKKVLRHDATNLNANWFLAEVRASQGLVADGEHHALGFLAAAEDVSGEIKEIFLKRCHELLTLYPESDAILEQLTGIFRLWDQALDSARASCLRACLLYAQGDEETAAEAMAGLLASCPELSNYPEHHRWLEVTGTVPTGGPPADTDVNAIDLDDGPAEADPTLDAGHDEAPALGFGEVDVDANEAPPSEAPVDETSFASLGSELADGEPGPAPAGLDWGVTLPDSPDEDGCVEIGDDAGGNLTSVRDGLASLADQAVASLAQPDTMENEVEEELDDEADHGGGLFSPGTGSVNLLDEILAEEGEDILRSSESEQVSTIASEIGRHVGESQDADPEAQYQQGLVYLELGLYDQAALAFEAASGDASHALQAREMWGISLQRNGQDEAALAVFEDGLVGCDEGDRLALGLRYHAGCILQGLGRADAAQEHFRVVHQQDAGFADVARRLRLQEA